MTKEEKLNKLVEDIKFFMRKNNIPEIIDVEALFFKAVSTETEIDQLQEMMSFMLEVEDKNLTLLYMLHVTPNWNWREKIYTIDSTISGMAETSPHNSTEEDRETQKQSLVKLMQLMNWNDICTMKATSDYLIFVKQTDPKMFRVYQTKVKETGSKMIEELLNNTIKTISIPDNEIIH